MVDQKDLPVVKEWKENFLKDWDRKCSICGKPVKKADLFPDGMPHQINGAVVGKKIEVYGHPTCIHNVDRIVVLENRRRVQPLLEKLKEELSKILQEMRIEEDNRSENMTEDSAR